MEDLIRKQNAGTYKRFDKAVYEVARAHGVDALPLLDALEFSRSIATGVGSLLNILRAQDDNDDGEDETPDSRFDHAQVDDLLGLCITSLDLLNSKIEAVADLMTARYGLQ